MSWFKHSFSLVGTAFLVIAAAGCERAESPGGEPVAVQAPPATQQPATQQPATQQSVVKDCRNGSWRAEQMQLGRETYESACASCHDGGKDDAPAIGDRNSWASRSQLWSAVLLEHAKNGYLDMPAKGGQPGLSDAAAEAAGEYMLCETFPELPRD